ncbi:MAG: CHC2 zinc finger domain-containing protein [Deltaproteobacteria bacterium]|nr:CHC2 zinc finger domain-containing protein [Deltaproteobacteria bacterium]
MSDWLITGTTFKDWFSPMEGEYTKKIILETFAPIFLRKCKEKLESLCNMEISFLGRAKTEDEKLFVLAFIDDAKKKLKEEIRYLELLLGVSKARDTKGARTNLKALKERARQYPICDLAANLGLNPKRAGRNYVILCPFHEESNPSCFLYPETNTYYCYGCHAHGDVIKFYMDVTGKGFSEAVNYLGSNT